MLAAHHSHSNRHRRLPTLIAAIVAACAAGGPVNAAEAAPGDDTTIEETTFDLAAYQAGSGVATCPSGRRVVGGGIGVADRIVLNELRASGPLDETGETAHTADGAIARSWYANVYNLGGASRTYRVFALCSASSDATIEESTIEVGASTVAGTTATCPAGRRVVGGGMGTTATDIAGPAAGSRPYVQVSGPTDETATFAASADGDVARSWYASVSNVSDTPKTYKVFALCSAGSDATIEATTLDAADAAGVATCPAGRRALGGGAGTDNPNGSLMLSGPLDNDGATGTTNDGDIATQWYANVYNPDASRTYRVFALCAPDGSAAGPAGTGGGAGGGTTSGAGGTAGGSAAGTTPAGGASGRPVLSGPVVSALTISPRNVRARRSGPSIAASGGSNVRYTLSAPATVRFAILAARSGRRVGASCVAPKRSNRRKRSCTRYVPLPGSFTHAGQPGANGFRFSGRLNGRKLALGTYRLSAAPDATSASPVLAGFRILNTSGRT